jgi:hypothetical protein
MDRLWVVSHYQSPYGWVKDYTNDFIVYDKDTLNVGYNIYDIMKFIVDHYENLPEVTVFIKDNILERHISKAEFEELKDNKMFTPLLTQTHETYLPVSYYKDGLYHERNDGWYFNHFQHHFFHSYKEFAEQIGLSNPEYLGFAPGGNYIVPKANILKHPKEFYKRLLGCVSYTQLPAEAHAIERSLYNIWS